MQGIYGHKNRFTDGRGAYSKSAAFSAVKARFAACVMIVFVLVASILFGLFGSSPAHAETAQTNIRTVKAGIFGFEGYHMKDDNGRLSGYGIEFLNLVSEYSHLNFEYTNYDKSWDETLQ